MYGTSPQTALASGALMMCTAPRTSATGFGFRFKHQFLNTF